MVQLIVQKNMFRRHVQGLKRATTVRGRVRPPAPRRETAPAVVTLRQDVGGSPRGVERWATVPSSPRLGDPILPLPSPLRSRSMPSSWRGRSQPAAPALGLAHSAGECPYRH